MNTKPTLKEICERKQRFSTRMKADVNALGRTNQLIKKGDTETKIRSYRCSVCGEYHLTSKPLKPNKK